MSIPRFGKIMPVHGEILSLIGWRLTRGESVLIEDQSERLSEMRYGREGLVQITGQDFKFDLAKWHKFLLDNDEYGYHHPYAFQGVDRAVRDAINDSEFTRCAKIAQESFG